MPSYVAFLRAVNVGKRMYKMAELRACLEASGLSDVETYIQTGNVRFTTPMRSRDKVTRHVESTLEAGCGFDVPAIVLTPQELRGVYDAALAITPPWPADEEGQRRYVTLLKAEPSPEAAATVEAWDFDGEHVTVRGRAVHWWLAKSFHEAKVSNARIEKALGTATTRDLKVITTLAERWGR